jgi:hypothetical protein
MIIPPYIFIKELLDSYNKYKICNENKKKFIECMNNYVIYNKHTDCTEYYDNIIKYNC